MDSIISFSTFFSLSPQQLSCRCGRTVVVGKCVWGFPAAQLDEGGFVALFPFERLSFFFSFFFAFAGVLTWRERYGEWSGGLTPKRRRGIGKGVRLYNGFAAHVHRCSRAQFERPKASVLFPSCCFGTTRLCVAVVTQLPVASFSVMRGYFLSNQVTERAASAA